jgi:hypothetical protein
MADSPEFFGDQWAQDVRAAVDRGPDAAAREGKLDLYWQWIDEARESYSSSWALGVRDLAGRGPHSLRLAWKDGSCVEASIVGPDDPLEATYGFAADLSTWRELLDGADPGRIVMYRQLRLVEGDVVRFFRSIYFFVESVAVIGRVPARMP